MAGFASGAAGGVWEGDEVGDENLDERLENHDELRLGDVPLVEPDVLSAELLRPKDGRDSGIILGELTGPSPSVVPVGVVATFSFPASGSAVGFGSEAIWVVAVGVGAGAGTCARVVMAFGAPTGRRDMDCLEPVLEWFDRFVDFSISTSLFISNYDPRDILRATPANSYPKSTTVARQK